MYLLQVFLVKNGENLVPIAKVPKLLSVVLLGNPLVAPQAGDKSELVVEVLEQFLVLVMEMGDEIPHVEGAVLIDLDDVEVVIQVLPACRFGHVLHDIPELLTDRVGSRLYLLSAPQSHVAFENDILSWQVANRELAIVGAEDCLDFFGRAAIEGPAKGVDELTRDRVIAGVHHIVIGRDATGVQKTMGISHLWFGVHVVHDGVLVVVWHRSLAAMRGTVVGLMMLWLAMELLMTVGCAAKRSIVSSRLVSPVLVRTPVSSVGRGHDEELILLAIQRTLQCFGIQQEKR